MSARFVGVDLHRSVVQLCVLSHEGAVLEEKRIRFQCREEGLEAVRFIVAAGPDVRVAVEALGLNRWFVNACRDAGLDVLVCDPRKLGLKKLGRKTDRRDAREIARHLWLGDLDRAARTYYPSDAEFGVRKLLRVRHRLVNLRQQTVNQLRGILNAYQITAPHGALYTGPSRRRLAAVKLPVAELQMAFDALVATLEAIHEQVEVLSRRVRELPRRDPRIAGLEAELPGIGAQSAATLIAELGDVDRFTHPRAVAAYAGLVPRVSQSADTAHHGRLTKQGNRELRWILSQWAVRLIEREPSVRAWAARRRQRLHLNKVRMALARRLLVGVWVMLTRGEAFDLDRCLGQA